MTAHVPCLVRLLACIAASIVAALSGGSYRAQAEARQAAAGPMLGTALPTVGEGAAADVRLELTSVGGVGATGSDGLLVSGRVVNASHGPIYVLNGLWTLDRNNHPIADPRGVYVFVEGSTLRLLLGDSPLPDASPTFTYTPGATLVQAGSSLAFTLRVDLPAHEHGAYSPGDPGPGTTVAVSKAEVLVQYVVPRGPQAIRPFSFGLPFVALGGINTRAVDQGSYTLRSVAEIGRTVSAVRENHLSRPRLPGDPGYQALHCATPPCVYR